MTQANAVAAVNEQAILTPPEMLKLALEKGAGVETLERLMAMKERWDANEARKAFVAALNAFKASPPKLAKDKEIRHKGTLISKYAGLDQVSAVIGAALSEHGITHRWEVEQPDKAIRVTCVLTHERGHSERVTLQAPADETGAKNAVQAIGSTVTYLQRYSLLAATGIAVQGQDDDGTAGGAGEVISDAQKDTLVFLLRDTGTDTKNFLTWAGVETVDELPAGKFADAVTLLKAKKARK